MFESLDKNTILCLGVVIGFIAYSLFNLFYNIGEYFASKTYLLKNNNRSKK